MIECLSLEELIFLCSYELIFQENWEKFTK